MPSRVARFLVGCALGLVLGLGYAWYLQPVTYYDTSPDTLRADYRTDYVLMVAQAYGPEGDLRLALLRLAALGPMPPVEIVTTAKSYSEAHAFSREDLDSLDDLLSDLRQLPGAPEIGSP